MEWSPKCKIPLRKASKAFKEMSNETVKLSTDFKDYPDDAFEKSGIEFERFRHAKISRKDAFDFLSSLKYRIPRYGYPKTLIPELIEKKQTEQFSVVVHLNEFDHDEFNKLLVSAKEAFDKYFNYFCVEYLPNVENHPVSYRYLKIGLLDYGLVYESNDTWRSNSGGVDVRIACHGIKNQYHPKLKYPLFSIDYIKSNDKLYAIDLDFAPVLQKTGIEVVLTPKQIYEEIAEAVKFFNKEK